MSHRANRNLVLKAAARFTKGLLCVIAPGPTRPTLKRYQPPRPALTVRVGVAGHLYIPETDELKWFVGQIFSAVALAANNLNDRHVRLLPGNQSNSQTAGLISLIRDAASQPVTEIDALIRRFRAAGRLSPPQPRCRLITSLASGADQFAAAIARDRHHFQIEAILPFPCDRFRRDIFNNCLTADFVPRQLRHRFALFSVERFENLCASAARVLQLEGAGTPRDAYRNAAEELLGHSDILLVLVGSQATDSGPGSSLWLVRRAREERVPVLRIYTDLCGSPRDPAWLSLLDGDSETPLEISALAPEIHKLMERILLPPPDVEPLRIQDSSSAVTAPGSTLSTTIAVGAITGITACAVGGARSTDWLTSIARRSYGRITAPVLMPRCRAARWSSPRRLVCLRLPAPSGECSSPYSAFPEKWLRSSPFCSRFC